MIGLRPGEQQPAPADLAVLELLAVPLAAALHATDLSRQLQLSRERIVAAREEERRRIRRDLHDGLGPTLAGAAFQADAVRNLLAFDPERAAGLLVELRAEIGGAVGEIRRLWTDCGRRTSTSWGSSAPCANARHGCPSSGRAWHGACSAS
ncbi:histidine kinase [Streptomyces sp. NPDC058470]|uniref:histidine kinase n=1 Tax=Streptomyces sp. NPDC058470 TaxID=3346515 RepID=UPI0036636CFD